MLPGDIGVKTGHTDNAGWCQVLADKQGSTTLYVTILGSPTRQQRNRDLASLASWGLGVFTIVQPVDAARTYATVDLPYGRAPLALVAGSALRTYIRPGRVLTQTIVAPQSVTLPVKRGQVLGRIEVRIGNTLLGRRPLVASRSVAKPGLGGRAAYYAGRTVHHIERWFT